MKSKLSWTERCEDGVKRETRVEVSRGSIKWQFKRADEAQWDYDRVPDAQDWDELQEILERRAGRGRALGIRESVARLRIRAGV